MSSSPSMPQLQKDSHAKSLFDSNAVPCDPRPHDCEEMRVNITERISRRRGRCGGRDRGLAPCAGHGWAYSNVDQRVSAEGASHRRPIQKFLVAHLQTLLTPDSMLIGASRLRPTVRPSLLVRQRSTPTPPAVNENSLTNSSLQASAMRGKTSRFICKHLLIP